MARPRPRLSSCLAAGVHAEIDRKEQRAPKMENKEVVALFWQFFFFNILLKDYNEWKALKENCCMSCHVTCVH